MVFGAVTSLPDAAFRDPFAYWLNVPLTLPLVAVISAVGFVAFYVIARLSITTPESGRAWILTLASASVMSVASVFCVVDWYRSVNGFGSSPSPPDHETYFSASTPLTDQMCIAFAVYLALDLLIGVFEYPKFIDPFTGWAHHTAYIVLCLYLVASQYSVGLGTFMVLEYPTVILSLGHINAQRCRSDMLVRCSADRVRRASLTVPAMAVAFGLLFFVTRIVYHVFLLSKYFLFQRSRLWIVISVLLAVHAWWWSKWAAKNIFCGRKSKRRNVASADKTH